MNHLRLLGVDDLLLLRLLLEGASVTAAATRLGLTQPAASHRIRKIEGVFGFRLAQRAGRSVRLTAEGHALASRADAAVRLLEGTTAAGIEPVVNLGTRPEVGLSWLWPALARLRRRSGSPVFHCVFGSG